MAVQSLPAAVTFVVERPTIPKAYLYAPPVDVTISVPSIEDAELRVVHPFFDGQVPYPPDWTRRDPLVFPLNRFKYDADGMVREALFSNHNDGMLLECDGDSLMGRSEIGRGAARKIKVVFPLGLEDGQLKIDFSDFIDFMTSADDYMRTATLPTTGDAKLTLKKVADVGWVMMNDGTIGDASSNASTRANIDCYDLYALLWNNIPDVYAPVTGGRGVSADADWVAHKPIRLTKQLGRSITVAGAGVGLTNRPLGGFAGEETHTMLAAEIASHAHGVNDPSHAHSVADYTHNHTLNDPTHAHGLPDPGHAHSVADPTHVHGVGGGYYYGWSYGTPINAAGEYSQGYRMDVLTGSDAAAYTGIGIYGAGTGMWCSGAYTGCYNSASGAGVGIYGAYTGITIQAYGNSTPFNVVHPVSFWNIMIKL